MYFVKAKRTLKTLYRFIRYVIFTLIDINISSQISPILVILVIVISLSQNQSEPFYVVHCRLNLVEYNRIIDVLGFPKLFGRPVHFDDGLNLV